MTKNQNQLLKKLHKTATQHSRRKTFVCESGPWPYLICLPFTKTIYDTTLLVFWVNSNSTDEVDFVYAVLWDTHFTTPKTNTHIYYDLMCNKNSK